MNPAGSTWKLVRSTKSIRMDRVANISATDKATKPIISCIDSWTHEPRYRPLDSSCIVRI